MVDVKSPREVADEAAEAIRTLNYLTGAGGQCDLEHPADVYDVIGGLQLAAARLPQLFGQMSAWLAAEQAVGRIRHDARQDPGEYVAAALDALHRAAEDAVTLAAALSTAHETCSSLTR